jgi:hypothetical protein
VYWFYFRSDRGGIVSRLRTTLHAKMGIDLSIGSAPAVHAVGRLQSLAV